MKRLPTCTEDSVLKGLRQPTLALACRVAFGLGRRTSPSPALREMLKAEAVKLGKPWPFKTRGRTAAPHQAGPSPAAPAPDAAERLADYVCCPACGKGTIGLNPVNEVRPWTAECTECRAKIRVEVEVRRTVKLIITV